MKSGSKLFLFAGIGLALVAVLLGVTMSSGDKTADAKKQEASTKVTVVRVITEIEAHQIIRSEMVEEVEVESSEASPDAATSRTAVLNQAYAVPAATGDILLMAFVESPGITSSIDPGMRAVSLKVNTQGSMSGLIVAGNYVDVVFQARVDLQPALTVEELIAQADASGSAPDREAADRDEADTADASALYEGEPGSEFRALDAGGELEPVAKMLVQDIKVIRVIQPGVSFDGQGQQAPAPEDSGASQDPIAQLIVQVTPQQAEAIAFIQDQNHTYTVAVRGDEDHAIVQTSGVTFQILMSDGTWSLPWPLPVVADEALEQRGTPIATSATPTAAPGDETGSEEETVPEGEAGPDEETT